MAMTFIVTAQRVPCPNTRGMMLKRGYQLTLHPELFSSHSELVEKLFTRSGWKEINKPTLGKVPSSAKTPPKEEKWLPHQLEIIKKLKTP